MPEAVPARGRTTLCGQAGASGGNPTATY